MAAKFVVKPEIKITPVDYTIEDQEGIFGNIRYDSETNKYFLYPKERVVYGVKYLKAILDAVKKANKSVGGK